MSQKPTKQGTIDKAFKPPAKKRSNSITLPVETKKQCLIEEEDTDDIRVLMGRVITRLDVLQECIDVLAAWSIPEESQEDMVDDELKTL